MKNEISTKKIEEEDDNDFLTDADDLFIEDKKPVKQINKEQVPLDKTNDILKQINDYLDKEKKKL